MRALAGPRAGNRYLAHVGGAGRLMELQGPAKCQETFARELLRFNRGGIVSTYLFHMLVTTSHVLKYINRASLCGLSKGGAIIVTLQCGVSYKLAQWLNFLRLSTPYTNESHAFSQRPSGAI
jgi:hypothetical protein